MTNVAPIGGFLLGAAALPFVAGRRRFSARASADARSLLAGGGEAVGPEQVEARWERLPEPVQRYLRYAVAPGAAAIRTVRLDHGGTFRTGPGRRWLPIEGHECFTAAFPGFVWRARVRLAPCLWIEARDRLQDGRGSMLVKMLSTFTMADASGARIDQGARLRWLAECPWFPYAFAGEDVNWEAIDGRSARASVRQVGLPASATFEFEEDGRIACVRAERYRDVGGGDAVLTPWRGRYSDYRDFHGFRVPASVDVAWILQDREFSYARFSVTAIDYGD